MAALCVAGPQAGAQTSLMGVVRDSRGAPQAGAVVELLRPDLTVAVRTLTDPRGRYRFASILPGVYEVKASAELFLPTLRENLHIGRESRIVVNLTLDTLYEAFRWLPAKPRTADDPKDDWTWTLRLAANRPLLRLLQDGPLVLVTDGNGGAPELKARVTVRGGDGGFGDGGVHNDIEMERMPDDARAMIFRADLSQADSPALNAMMGYEQQVAPGRTFRTITALESRPEIVGGPGMQGLQAIEMRTGETLALGPGLQAEFGDEAEAVHMGGTLLANRPFASVALHDGNLTFAYRMTTAPGIQQVEDLDSQETVEPLLAERNGQALLEKGMHQEISVDRSTGKLRMRVAAWHESVENPVITGGGSIAQADWNAGNLLYDPTTDLLRAAGASYAGNGMMSEIEEQVNGATWISFDVAVGEALGMDNSAAGATSLAAALNGMTARETPMVSAGVRGKLAQAGTQWRASYSWQDPHTVTAVDAFAAGSPDAYLSFTVRQPIRYRRVIPNGVEALVDVRNLLAEGYRPFVTKDGSTLYFAQAARCIEGGLSFTF